MLERGRQLVGLSTDLPFYPRQIGRQDVAASGKRGEIMLLLVALVVLLVSLIAFLKWLSRPTPHRQPPAPSGAKSIVWKLIVPASARIRVSNRKRGVV